MAYTSSQVVQAVPTGINSALVYIGGGSLNGSAELAQLEVHKADAQTQADAKAANDAKVLSAKKKLKALGLTEAEVTALVG
jgi:hypothetical protein